MMPRSIAKVNAKSIDGHFGVGTSCFFIRGTILSDTPINGDYPSLAFMRPGNIVEIESFDRIWAVVSIRTRAGNRPGDNVTARLYLRDDDLKAHGIDCERIELLNGLPFSFDVASLTAEGLFDHQELEPYEPVEDDPDPPHVEPAPARPRRHRRGPHRHRRLRRATACASPCATATPTAAASARTPTATAEHPVRRRRMNRRRRRVRKSPSRRRRGRSRNRSRPSRCSTSTNIIELIRSGNSPLGKIGASVAAVAVPVLIYMAMALLKGKPPPDEE